MAHARKLSVLLSTMKQFAAYDCFLPVFSADLIDTEKFDPNMIDDTGSTPLLIACHHHHFEILKWLVELGAIVNPLHSKQEETPLCALINPSYLPSFNSYQASEEKVLNIVRYLVAHGAEINNRINGEYQYSAALLQAAQKQYYRICLFLIEQGAIIDTDHSKTEIVKKLLKKSGLFSDPIIAI